ncbi:TrkH family potassium uptake protein [Hathewaya histolytica]|uniref:Potassium uptake protein, TrkH family n=1 Tax=Hathewaya histolytica TaxID=1498 RepID=A0A4U9RL63_HATHI|nr:TrkH family potassium uptake protein [Hathewaya histolytica]VTQ92892.1 potassium uptake protein, TrkH family [Hathewaya histolytica]
MEKSILKQPKRIKPVQVLAVGFASVIFIGALLLMLPISSAKGNWTNFIDCLFTSTSATCVTGLISVDTGTYWSYFGKTVIISLIQIGGLGFMSLATLIFLLLGKKITLKERLVMQEAMNSFSMQGLVKMSKYILLFTFSIEGIGALILSTQFIPRFGIKKGIYYSIFHSISAFCNAGFDLMGNFTSLTNYSNNTVIILTISALIITGGLGFFVWNEIYSRKKLKKFSLHTKLVLWATLILIVGGAILMFLFEMNNPNTIANKGVKEKILSSIFASVSPRTAGFNSISTSDMSLSGRFLTTLLMFIGGSPGSTAGGIKTTTITLLIFTLLSVIKGREDTEIFNKRISKEVVYKGIVILMISFLLIAGVTMALCITETGFTLEEILYEAVSGFGTVGLTLGITTKLSNLGKIIIAMTMYFGRVGPLTIVLALTNRNGNKGGIKYPEGKILIG